LFYVRDNGNKDVYIRLFQINGVDVTRKTHHECVKLIKKTGDTLALKVFTPRVASSGTLSSLASATQAAIYQSQPASFYAASNLVDAQRNNSLHKRKCRKFLLRVSSLFVVRRGVHRTTIAANHNVNDA
jgi:hypothetical protein